VNGITGPVLVTGATGFIGRHLVDRLVAERLEVHALQRSGGADARPGTTRWSADLRDAAAVADLVARVRPRTVFHLSGHTAGRGRIDGAAVAEAFDVNVGGTLALWRALEADAPALSSVVAVGGLEEYGNGPVPFVETQREQPISAYSASQVAATHLSQYWHRAHGLPVTVLRLALVYGPGQPSTFLVPALIEACLADRPFALTAGTQTREYVYVADVVEGLCRAAVCHDAAGRVVNIGDGVERRVVDVARLVAERAGRPERLQVGSRPPRASEVQRMVSDSTLARQLLGWSATTSFEDGIARTIAWHRRQAQAPSECGA
jgi:UDP-glucose 4-epimerase